MVPPIPVVAICTVLLTNAVCTLTTSSHHRAGPDRWLTYQLHTDQELARWRKVSQFHCYYVYSK